MAELVPGGPQPFETPVNPVTGSKPTPTPDLPSDAPSLAEQMNAVEPEVVNDSRQKKLTAEGGDLFMSGADPWFRAPEDVVADPPPQPETIATAGDQQELDLSGMQPLDTPLWQDIQGRLEGGSSWDEINQDINNLRKGYVAQGYSEDEADAAINGALGLKLDDPRGQEHVTKELSKKQNEVFSWVDSVADAVAPDPFTGGVAFAKWLMSPTEAAEVPSEDEGVSPAKAYVDGLLRFSSVGEVGGSAWQAVAGGEFEEGFGIPPEYQSWGLRLANELGIATGAVVTAAAFSRTGAMIGGVAGPKGRAIGALTGAIIGLGVDAATRESYAYVLSGGFAKDGEDYMILMQKASLSGAEAMATGAIMMGGGLLLKAGAKTVLPAAVGSSKITQKGAQISGEMLGFVVATKAMADRFPTLEEFVLGGAMIAAFHTARNLKDATTKAIVNNPTINGSLEWTKRLMDDYVATGRHPGQAVKDIQKQTGLGGLADRTRTKRNPGNDTSLGGMVNRSGKVEGGTMAVETTRSTGSEVAKSVRHTAPTPMEQNMTYPAVKYRGMFFSGETFKQVATSIVKRAPNQVEAFKQLTEGGSKGYIRNGKFYATKGEADIEAKAGDYTSVRVNGEDMLDAWRKLRLGEQEPVLRTRAWDAVVSKDGTVSEVANWINKANGNADRFNELRREGVQERYNKSPDDYEAGDLDAYLTRMDPELPMSPDAMQEIKDIKAGKAPRTETASDRASRQQESGYFGRAWYNTKRELHRVFDTGNMSDATKSATAIIRAAYGRVSAIEARTKAALGHKALYETNKRGNERDLYEYVHGKRDNMPLTTAPEVVKAAELYRDRFRKTEEILRELDLSDAETGQFFKSIWENKAGEVNEFVRKFGEENKTGKVTKDGTIKKVAKIPSISDGLKAGLKLRGLPAETLQMYITAADSMIAARDVALSLEESGLLTWTKDRGARNDDWVRVKELGERNGNAAFAPDDVASLLRNFYSKGFGDTSLATTVETLTKMSNSVTQMKLAASGYHALTSFEGAMSLGFGHAIDLAVRQKAPMRAALELFKAPARPVTAAVEGFKQTQKYLGLRTMNPQEAEVMSLLIDAGMRDIGHRPVDYRTSQQGGMVKAWMEGRLGKEFEQQIAAFEKGAPVQNVVQAGKMMANYLGRFLQDVTGPLFDHYIPYLKMGTNTMRLSNYLKANPGATHEQKLAEAKRIIDQTDDIHGEMINDNLMMDVFMKQALGAALLSRSWTIGQKFRMFGVGAVDSAKFMRDFTTGRPLDFTPKMAHLLGMTMTVALLGVTLQYLMTGEGPRDIMDVVAPRTGGTNWQGEEFRTKIPGAQKDAYGAYYDSLTGRLTEAVSPFWKTLWEGVQNEDWKGQPIVPPDESGFAILNDEWIPHMAEHFFKGMFSPITAEQWKKVPKSAKMPFLMKLFGFTEASPYFRDSEWASKKHQYEMLEYYKKERFDQRQRDREEEDAAEE
jgi:hypothetical protein